MGKSVSVFERFGARPPHQNILQSGTDVHRYLLDYGRENGLMHVPPECCGKYFHDFRYLCLTDFIILS